MSEYLLQPDAKTQIPFVGFRELVSFKPQVPHLNENCNSISLTAVVRTGQDVAQPFHGAGPSPGAVQAPG